MSENPETLLSVLDIKQVAVTVLALANSCPDWKITASDLPKDALSQQKCSVLRTQPHSWSNPTA